MREEKMRRILSGILKCGEFDVDLLLDIDEDILLEAIGRLNEGNEPLDFPTLFTEAVEAAKAKYNLKIKSIDANYLASRVYATDERSRKKLEELGFPAI